MPELLDTHGRALVAAHHTVDRPVEAIALAAGDFPGTSLCWWPRPLRAR